MKELLKKFLLFSIVAALLFSLAGCKGSAEKKEDNKDGQKDEKMDKEDSGSDYPDWFLNPPSAEDTLYAVGIAQKSNFQLAVDAATARARNELARVIKVKVSTLTKDFLEEAGVSGESKSTEFTQVVSKQISDNTISGSKRQKVHVDKTTNPDTVYVLVNLNLADMSGAIEEVIKNQEAAYSRLQARKSFSDLEEELKKLKADEYSSEPIVVSE